MPTIPKIAIILGTTRQGRFADKPAQWILNLAQARTDARFELIDLRDWPLPFFDEPAPVARTPPKNEVAQRWSAKLDEFDGFLFVTAEYNHSIPAVLKNAIDYAYREFNRKPAAFVAYGGVGGARAVEQLRLIAVEMQLAPLRDAVHIGRAEFVGMLMEGKSFDDFPHLGATAQTMLSDLVWWTNALKVAREADAAAAAPTPDDDAE
ncbi:MAG: putative reductase [Caulobacteraceae bacterium]|nr:putative reductase [Caulobacteraceae bacterium]